MRQTTIPFCPTLPDSWQEIPNKYLFKYHSKKVGEEWASYQLLSLTTSGVKEKDINAFGGKVPDSYSNYQTVEPGDMIFCLFDLDVSAVFSGLSSLSGMITSAYDVVAPNKTLLYQKYSDYWFQYAFSNRYYKIYSKNIRFTIGSDMFGSIKTPVPPMEDQIRIGDFLEKKRSEIDSLIAIEEEQIEKLNEYRLSLITETVSNGLSDRAFVASGVDWIRTIPAGWRIQKVLSQLAMPITDGPHTTPELLPEGVAFVSAEAVSCGNGRIDFDHIRGFISEEFYQECCLKYVPKINDVYMIKSGATTGRVSIVDSLEPKFTIWSPLAVMRCDENKMFPKFLFYAVQSIHFQRQIALGWSFGTQQNLGMRTLEQLKLIVPPFDEQKEIATYLDEKLASLASLIELKKCKIEKLGEYRKSLIFECVTGKRVVGE